MAFLSVAFVFILISAAFGAPVSAPRIQVQRPEKATWKRTQCGGLSGHADIPSKWGLEVSPDSIPLKQYPRPQMVRGDDHLLSSVLRDSGDPSTWINLNGLWEWQKADSDLPPFGQSLASSILVPFPVESCLSGVAPLKSADIVMKMWYRLTFDVENLRKDRKTLLHFGAVDWQSKVYLNHVEIANHTGGYDGFSIDISEALQEKNNELLVYAYDPSDTGKQPNGKQRISAIDRPGGDTYTPNSGIWQTVWLESVPQKYIKSLKIDQSSLSTVIVVAQLSEPGAQINVEVRDEGKTIASSSGISGAGITLTVPSSVKLWSPDSPKLYDLVVNAGEDTVLSYFGLRTFTLGKPPVIPGGEYVRGYDRAGADMAPCSKKGCIMSNESSSIDCRKLCNTTRGCMAFVWAPADCSGASGPICWLKNSITSGTHRSCRDSQVMPHAGGIQPLLNGKFTFMAGFLDQSWWPDGQYTAPSDAALESDLLATKMFGFNMIRLHQKVNPERWYYHADRHGVVIFQDMIQKYGRASAETIPFFVNDLTAMIEGRSNHPSIVQWTAFNEGDCFSVFRKKPYDVLGITQLIKKLDPTRLVDTDSGGGANNYHFADVNDIHSYPYPFRHHDPQASNKQYAMVGEFGGIGAFVKGKEWVPDKCFAYLRVNSSLNGANTYVEMSKTILSRVDHVSASVYTQTTDVELECDGFLNYDRSNKFSAAETNSIAAANQALVHAVQRRQNEIMIYVNSLKTKEQLVSELIV